LIPTESILICMTSDFAYDQRMQRIASSLAEKYEVAVLHRSNNKNIILYNRISYVSSIHCKYKSGILFYVEFNLRLTYILLRRQYDIIYSVDADTLLACTIKTVFADCKMIYDSHEYFIKTPELHSYKIKQWIWRTIENIGIKKASLNITVTDSIAQILSKRTCKGFLTIRNLPVSTGNVENQEQDENILIYQGAINAGRGLECAIDAMQYLPQYKLILIGNGDVKNELKNRINAIANPNQVEIIDAVSPSTLKTYTAKAKFGLNLLEAKSESYYYSLANKFFDYMHADVPSINMNFPEYEKILNEHKVGLMVEKLDAEYLAKLIIANSSDLPYDELKNNCRKYKSHYTWQNEQLKLFEAIESL
jgi:glycosyltransferase involved in cell wall biosynthesis